MRTYRLYSICLNMYYIIDMHTHTIASGHAYSTIQENINAAKEKGLKLLGISDHAPALPGSAYIYYFQNLKVIPKEVMGIRILKGVEANIIDFKGSIDMAESELKLLDYCIASMHPPCIEFGTKKENTNAVIKAMENKYVKIIGHPDDSRYPLDYEEVVKAAKENHVLLEVNNSSLNPKGFRQNSRDNVKEILRLSIKYNHPIILGSDAHFSYGVGDFNFCEEILKEIDFPEELVVNKSIDCLFSFLD